MDDAAELLLEPPTIGLLRSFICDGSTFFNLRAPGSAIAFNKFARSFPPDEPPKLSASGGGAGGPPPPPNDGGGGGGGGPGIFRFLQYFKN